MHFISVLSNTYRLCLMGLCKGCLCVISVELLCEWGVFCGRGCMWKGCVCGVLWSIFTVFYDFANPRKAELGLNVESWRSDTHTKPFLSEPCSAIVLYRTQLTDITVNILYRKH